MRGTAVAFKRTLRAIDPDRSGRWISGIVITTLLFIGWGYWFLGGKVSVYAVTDQTLLEAEAAAHPIATRVEGRVVSSNLELGKMVKAGELLVELDAATERLALEETKARLAGLRSQIQSLYPEIQAERQGLDAHQKATELAVEKAKARVVEARAWSHFADQQAQSRHALIGQHLVSKEDYQQAQASAEANNATVKALELDITELERAGLVQAMDHQARIAKLERKLADLQGQTRTAEATAGRIEHDIALRLIPAPTSGQLGRVEPLRVGAVVHAGEVLGTVVPAGRLRAVAFFPLSKVGKMRPGQRAQLRLDAFPWTQYGTLQATVASVGNDPLDGRVRVELTLHSEYTPTIPVAHGLSGTAEVEIERVSPAELLLRAVGRRLTTKPAERAAAAEPRGLTGNE